MSNLPLLPLHTVLLPGNSLSLKIFEPRYVDMIAKCMREDSIFGVVQIYSGEEIGVNNEIHSIGTTARISDWQNRSDGLLGIIAIGAQRFEIISTNTQKDGLCIADIKILEEEPFDSVPEQYLYMQELLNHINQQEGKQSATESSFGEVLYRLTYLLPLENNLKQRLLEIPNSFDRAVILHAELIRLGVIQYINPDTESDGPPKPEKNKGH
ncbi:MAG: Lon protease-like protein [Gammaproteobacteria bacterium]|jgi:Lon protease-like protein